MIETFTKAIVREIGRNYGKAASNKLLGDSHSTPYRRVGGNSGGKVTLGASSRGYKYENQLDRLIRTFQVKGKLATFNSAQNIYNEYFKLVEEANTDNDIDSLEAIYLVKQYYRTAETLNNISLALKEMDAQDKSQKVIEKIINLNEFMKSLNESYEEVKGEELKVSKKFNTYTNYCAFIFLITLVLGLFSLLSSIVNINDLIIYTIFVISFVSFIYMWTYSSKYSRHKKEVQNYNENLRLARELKSQINKAANSLEVEEVKS